MAKHLERRRDVRLGDVAYTLQVGRRAFPHRFYTVVTDAADTAEVLRKPDPRISGAAHHQGEAPEILFVVPGLGPTVEDQGAAYYEHVAAFRKSHDRCADFLEEFGWTGPAVEGANGAGQASPTRRGEGGVASGLPDSFVTNYALAQSWIAWGIRPRALVGHGLGEVVAACLSGVLQPEDALRYLLRLGELTPEAREDRQAADDISEGLWEVCAEMHFGRPKVPWFSSVSGRLIDMHTASDPTYWSRLPHAKDRFREAVSAALAGGVDLVLESGPGSGLTTVREAVGHDRLDWVRALPAEAGGADAEWSHALSGLGRCWLAGCDIEWEALHRDSRRVCLPTYPFERVTHHLPTRAAVERATPVAEV
jgi:acyl transferase domain-containing protein